MEILQVNLKAEFFKQFELNVQNQNLENLIALVSNIENIDFKTVSRLKPSLLSLNSKVAKEWAVQLFELSPNHVVVGGKLFELTKIWNRDVSLTLNVIKKLANGTNWQNREIAIDLLSKSLRDNHSFYSAFFEELINEGSIYERRVAISTAKKISFMGSDYDKLKNWVFNKIKVFIHEEDPFVSSAVYDTYANGFTKRSPEIIFPWIESIISKTPGTKLLIKLLRMLNTVIQIDFVSRVLDILEKTIASDDPKLFTIRSTILKQLCKNYSEKVNNWIEGRMDQIQIVSHWADLAVEGLIVSNY